MLITQEKRLFNLLYEKLALRGHLDDIKKYVPEFIPEFVPEFVSEFVPEFIPEFVQEFDLNTYFY